MQGSESFKVSVIIPIYNAFKYLEDAVISAINLENTGEVILIDDGSTDGSLEKAKQLANKYENLCLLHHAGNANYGPAKSRNLGIKKSKFPFISFLDADDYYLPNRFLKDRIILLGNNQVEAVYGCNQAIFETDHSKYLFFRNYSSATTTLMEPLANEHLFKALLLGGVGRFHTSAITIRKSLFSKTGLFNETLRYGEDSELWFKCSLVGNIIAGEIYQPISIRRVHENNSIHNLDKAAFYSRLMYKDLFDWAILKPFSFEVKNDLLRVLCIYYYHNKWSVKRILFAELKKRPALVFTTFWSKKFFSVLFHNFFKRK